MSWLDNNHTTSAWTTIRIDYGSSAASRWGGWAPVKWLNNSDAMQYAARYPLGSTIFQWDARRGQWVDVLNPSGRFGGM